MNIAGAVANDHFAWRDQHDIIRMVQDSSRIQKESLSQFEHRITEMMSVTKRMGYKHNILHEQRTVLAGLSRIGTALDMYV
ncbi:hypothetical protein K8I28_00770 [bacterium]|nr:hypothetical protein [bacterium]